MSRKLDLTSGSLYGEDGDAEWPAHIVGPGTLADLTAATYDVEHAELRLLPAWQRPRRYRELHPEEEES